MAIAQRSSLLRRVWLPRWLYESLPWLYLLVGGSALAGGLFGTEGGWFYPYLALLGLAVLHGGVWIMTLRYRWRRNRQDHPDGEPTPASLDSRA